MDTNNQSVIIDGANPSMLWYNIADYIGNLSKNMVKTYKQRQRSNKQITWGELDKVNQDLHNQLDIIISGDRNVKTISENREMNKKQVIRLNENQLKQIVTESVKRILRENDDFTPHGYMAKSNFGGAEVQISKDGSAARFRNNYGTPDKPTDWLEIEFDEEGVAYVTLPNGEQERLDNYMKY